MTGVDQSATDLQPGGNMEGKEARFGVTSSGLWAAATTAASNGSVSSMHDSYMPLGGLVPMWLMQLGEVVFGVVGSGLYGMLVYAVVAVFVAGLMVGRTPEYLGKKIEAYEMKMASLVILLPAAVVLLGAAVAVSTDAGRGAVTNPGPHGFSQVLYWVSSTGNNNGSAFAGLGSNNPLDPHVSPAAARFQIDRVARARSRLPEDVARLVERYTEARALGVLGEPRVNVLLLNLALDGHALDGHAATRPPGRSPVGARRPDVVR